MKRSLMAAMSTKATSLMVAVTAVVVPAAILAAYFECGNDVAIVADAHLGPVGYLDWAAFLAMAAITVEQ